MEAVMKPAADHIHIGVTVCSIHFLNSDPDQAYPKRGFLKDYNVIIRIYQCRLRVLVLQPTNPLSS